MTTSLPEINQERLSVQVAGLVDVSQSHLAVAMLNHSETEFLPEANQELNVLTSSSHLIWLCVTSSSHLLCKPYTLGEHPKNDHTLMH